MNYKNYTTEIARTTNNPKLLTEILRHGRNGRDNDVTQCAVRNQNCPSEILAEILRMGKDDLVSRNAAYNPNCTPEILTEILRRKKMIGFLFMLPLIQIVLQKH